jgi:hypothetical protein
MTPKKQNEDAENDGLGEILIKIRSIESKVADIRDLMERHCEELHEDYDADYDLHEFKDTYENNGY